MENFRDSTPEAVYGYLAGLAKKLDGVFGRHGYMLIGSYVRDIYMVKAGIQSPRATHDVDFSALVVSEEKFLEQLEEVGYQSGGTASHHVTCRVIDRVDVDVLPFGPVIPGGIFRFKDAEWDITGHEEACTCAEVFELGGTGVSVKIPPLEALLGLKIIAWGMRGEDGCIKTLRTSTISLKRL